MAAAGFARPEGGRAAADQADQRAGMVRSTERSAAHQAARRQLHARCGVDHRGLQRDLWRERRQQPRQALGEHRLAGPRRADEQQVVPAGGGDLQCPPGRRLAADVGQVERRRRILHRCLRGRIGPRRLASGNRDQLGEVGDVAHRSLRGDPGLAIRARGHHHRLAAGGRDHRRGADDGTNRPVQAELADERVPGKRTGRQLLVGDEDPDGDRQVEPRSALALRGRGQVHRDPLGRPGEPTRQNGGAHPIARLAARLVRQADDRIGRQAAGDVDLHRDGVPLRTEDRGGIRGGDHRTSSN